MLHLHVDEVLVYSNWDAVFYECRDVCTKFDHPNEFLNGELYINLKLKNLEIGIQVFSDILKLPNCY